MKQLTKSPRFFTARKFDPKRKSRPGLELPHAVLKFAFAFAILASGLSLPAAAVPVDAAAAEALMLDSGCNKCHKVDKKKDGPAYRDVAAKYRGKPDAEATVTHHVTSGEMVKFDDGHEERHKKVKAKNADEVKNIVNWILSMEGGKKY